MMTLRHGDQLHVPRAHHVPPRVSKNVYDTRKTHRVATCFFFEVVVVVCSLSRDGALSKGNHDAKKEGTFSYATGKEGTSYICRREGREIV